MIYKGIIWGYKKVEVKNRGDRDEDTRYFEEKQRKQRLNDRLFRRGQTEKQG